MKFSFEASTGGFKDIFDLHIDIVKRKISLHSQHLGIIFEDKPLSDAYAFCEVMKALFEAVAIKLAHLLDGVIKREKNEG